MVADPLRYRAALHVGGLQYETVETYEQVMTRLRDSAGALTPKDDDTASIAFPSLIELTVRQASTDKPVRMAFAPGAIMAVLDLPDEQQVEVKL